MATAHFTRTTYKSGGQDCAVQRIQYITREGPYSPATARIQHQRLEAGTARPREDLVQWEHANLPAWAKDDPVRYFSAAERYEGANRVAYTEWRFSLPRELSRVQQVDAARDVLQAAFGDRHPCVWALHDPPATDGGANPTSTLSGRPAPSTRMPAPRTRTLKNTTASTRSAGEPRRRPTRTTSGA